VRVPAVCAGGKTLQPVADQHGDPRPPNTKGCESKRRLVRIVPPIHGLWHCFTHTSCVCNDIVACVNRVVGEVPLPTQAGVRRIRQAMKQLWPVRSIAPIELHEALQTFKGTKRKLYIRAYESLAVEPISAKDAKIKAFVKAERFDPEDKENPDPRMIQSRDPRYNLHLACYLRPLEHEIYQVKRHGLPMIVKCKNPAERAQILQERWAQFENPVCFSVDCSRWDKHVSLKVLKEELNFYESWFPGDPLLKQLLTWQRVNHCTTSNGVKYSVVGGRMSGDMNTALGNCILMVSMVTAAMNQLGVKHYELIDDGDDCLIIVEKSQFALLNEQLPKVFLDFGQELKLENIAYNINDVMFCQSKPTFNGTEWTFARNWRKVLSQSCCGTKHWNDPNMVRPMFGLLGDCENALHRGIPILQVYATRLRELSRGHRARLVHLDSSYQYRVGSYRLENVLDLGPSPITWEARVQFERTWGVDPSMQLHLEQAIRSWDPGVVLRDVGPEFVGGWPQVLDLGISNPTVL
jgi:hypothetical protein